MHVPLSFSVLVCLQTNVNLRGLSNILSPQPTISRHRLLTSLPHSPTNNASLLRRFCSTNKPRLPKSANAATMSGHNQQLKDNVARLQQDLITTNYDLEETAKQLQIANTALKAADANDHFPWTWVSVAVIFLVICILSGKSDESARMDAMLDRVVSMSRAFEQIKSICESNSVPKTAVQSILSIVAATNTTGACHIKA